MEAVFYFFGIAVLVASVFLVLDTQQNRRLNKLTKETKNVQPLFLQRAIEQKLIAINSFLYDNTVRPDMMPVPVKREMSDRARQELSARLGVIISERNNGKISLQDYNGKLNDLLSRTRGIK
jgi:hypothetical protein